MTKLTSGRVEKVDSANVSADRYQFLSLKEAEPDLGLPTTAGQVFTSNTTGSRYWTTLDTGNVVETSNLYYLPRFSLNERYGELDRINLMSTIHN